MDTDIQSNAIFLIRTRHNKIKRTKSEDDEKKNKRKKLSIAYKINVWYASTINAIFKFLHHTKQIGREYMCCFHDDVDDGNDEEIIKTKFMWDFFFLNLCCD